MSKPACGGCSQDECAGLYPDRFYRNVSPSLRLGGCACACMSHTHARGILSPHECDPEIEGIQTQLVDTAKNHYVIRLEAPVTGFVKRIPYFEIYFALKLF